MSSWLKPAWLAKAEQLHVSLLLITHLLLSWKSDCNKNMKYPERLLWPQSMAGRSKRCQVLLTIGIAFAIRIPAPKIQAYVLHAYAESFN